MLYVQISVVILCLTSYQILCLSVWNIYVQETHEIILAWTVHTQVISTKIILFVMHSCILLNLHVTLPFLSKVGCSDCRNILWCSQESQHGGASILVSRTSLRCLSFHVYKAEVIYRFKYSSAVLELLCPHTDVFCINSYKCSDYYHFL